MRELFLLLCAALAGGTPPYFATVANQALRLKGDARFGTDMSVQAVVELERQVKRVLGSDPARDLNVSATRSLPEPELLRILLLAVLGNYTSAAGSGWQRPCSLVVDPRTGLVGHEEPPALASLTQKVVMMLLVAVQFKRWVDDARGARRREAED